MSDRTKKILMVIALIAVTALLGFILFLFATNRAIPGLPFTGPAATTTPGQLPPSQTRTSTPGVSVTPTQPGQLTPGGILPGEPSGSYYQPQPVTRVNTSAVAYPSGSTQNGGLRYYNQGDGKFYHVGANGEIEPLSDQQFYRVSKVTWAPNTNKAVLEYPDQTKIVYNFDTKKQVTLPKHWEDFSFSSDGNELAAKSMTLSPENRALIISKDDGTGERAIQELGSYADRVAVDWSPSRQTVALSQTGDPVGGERRQVLLVGQNQENFKPITTEGLNFQSSWSPSGQHLLYSVDSSRTDYKPELWITESYGDRIDANRRSLEINTWAEKCSFADESTLYCAVPRDLPSGAGVLPEAATYPTDDIYRIDTKTGARVAIPLDGENRRIKSLNFDKRNNKLFFTEQDNLGLFEVKL